MSESPLAHFNSLGGYSAIEKAHGTSIAHRLWDCCRLWQRDLGKPNTVPGEPSATSVFNQPYWEALYFETINKINKLKEEKHVNT
jgi:hypothetical protein